MRHIVLGTAIALVALLWGIGADRAWADDPAPGQGWGFSLTALQPEGEAAPPPPPPPALEPVVPEGMPAAPPVEAVPMPPLAPPTSTMVPPPSPTGPPPGAIVVYERQGMGTAMMGAPCAPPCAPPCPTPCPPKGCELLRDAEGYSITPQGCRYGCFEVWVEGMYSLLDSPEGLFGEPPYIAGPLLAPDPIEWDGLDYEGAFGGRLTLRFRTGPQEFLELRGTYYGSWDDETRDGTQFGFSPGPDGVGGVIAPNVATLTSEAEIYGGELNYWSEIACLGLTSYSLGLGVHWVQFNETAAAGNWALPFAPFATPPYVESDVENMFIGLQLGGQVRYEFTPCFDMTLVLKGMLGNINRDVEINDNSIFSGGAHYSSSEENEIVFGADVDLMFRYRFGRHIAITAGYNFLFVDNVLRAHDAMDFTQSNSGAVQPVQDVDQLVVHSFLVGLQFTF